MWLLIGREAGVAAGGHQSGHQGQVTDRVCHQWKSSVSFQSHLLSLHCSDCKYSTPNCNRRGSFGSFCQDWIYNINQELFIVFFFNYKKMFFMPWTPQKHKFHPNTAPPCIPWIRGQKDDDETFSHGRDPDCPVELVWVAVEKLCDAPDRPLYNRLTARHNATLSRVFCNAFIWATVFCTNEQSNDKTSTINLQNLL